jgi:TolB-like protein
LNPQRIESDACGFRASLQSGELAHAAALYAGPFLDGFFLSGAPEFDRWVENERAGFAREFTECLETLAADAAARGDLRKASEWWQRLAEHDPLSSRVTVHLMSALAAAGNRAGALERARSYQELVERELEAAPNPAVLALAEQLRRSPPGREGVAAPVSPSSTAVAVLPFANLSPVEQNDFFAEGLVEEVMSALARLDGIRVAARRSAAVIGRQDLDAREIGRRLEVDALLEGSVRQAEDRVRLSVELVDVSDGHRLWSERFERRAADSFALQDELAAAIVQGMEAPLRGLRRRSG